MEKSWLEPKIRSFSPLYFHPFLPRSPVLTVSVFLLLCPSCQATVTFNQSNSHSVVKLLLLCKSLAEAGTMCELSTAIWMTTAVSQSNSSTSALFTVIFRIPCWIVEPVDLALNNAGWCALVNVCYVRVFLSQIRVKQKPYTSLETSSTSAACNLITKTRLWRETERGKPSFRLRA